MTCNLNKKIALFYCVLKNSTHVFWRDEFSGSRMQDVFFSGGELQKMNGK